ncbi:PACE efflux transporter [uncultured Aquabacterium sp.]|uniref:PACE efflux transporter n=1 Tax=uncultured Aquabacterium sp. TaxID=158753 RepID=UPI0025D07513|nr:PACE efflux transporter [uncultured Aquabacterium sp.]
MQGIKRKVVHATLYEAVAIAMLAVIMQPIAGKGLGDTGPFAIACSVIAVSWNLVYNTLFEAWERRQVDRRRTPRRRALHAIGFEGGLVLMTLPLIAWALDMGWWAALLADLGLVALFLVYTFCFNWVFDHVFGLPASAQQAGP